jgi:hypothetical protein
MASRPVRWLMASRSLPETASSRANISPHGQFSLMALVSESF